jgi:GGDEF domain-containing protein
VRRAVCYRLGGDEFAVLIEQANTKFAAAIAEEIRAAIDAGRPGHGDLRVTASF